MSDEHSVGAGEVTALEVPRVGRVEPGPDASLPWRVLDAGGIEVAEVSGYLRDLTASDFSPASVKSYAPATINHNLAVVSGFYGYQLEGGRGPLRNGVLLGAPTIWRPGPPQQP